MPAISTNDLKNGITLEIDKVLYQVVEFQHVKPGKGGAFVRSKLRNLRNGQTVEIITAKGATPNPAWVNFVVTAKARASIRQYLKNLKRSEAIDLGKRLLNQSLEEFSLTLRKIPSEPVAAVVVELGLRTPDELFEKIGLGERVAPFIARRLLPADSEGVVDAVAGPLAIAGTEGLLVSYARCCFPIPNDPILASLSAGRGVVIHREA